MADSRENHIWYLPDGTAVPPEDKKSMRDADGKPLPLGLFREEGRPEPITGAEWDKLNARHLALDAIGKGKDVDALISAGARLPDALDKVEAEVKAAKGKAAKTAEEV